MFNLKGAMLVAAATAVAGLLVAGMALTVTTGSASDVGNGNLSGFPSNFDIPAPSADSPATNPPASPLEPPAGSMDPNAGTVDNNAGAPGAGATGPSGLPDAGYGEQGGVAGVASVLMLLAIAGASLVGAGASITSDRRR
jgi:hypothetical protein